MPEASVPARRFAGDDQRRGRWLIGLMVIQRVSRLLHTPLMSLTNAISAIAVVGAILIAGEEHASPFSRWLGFIAVVAATVNYLGKVMVAKGADGTDGSQSVRAMLLDRQSAANAKPELEIHADDVKCAHGCAVGELDAGALFYMASRGVPPELAKRLMLQAFVAEAFVGAADEEALLAQALAALEAML